MRLFYCVGVLDGLELLLRTHKMLLLVLALGFLLSTGNLAVLVLLLPSILWMLILGFRGFYHLGRFAPCGRQWVGMTLAFIFIGPAFFAMVIPFRLGSDVEVFFCFAASMLFVAWLSWSNFLSELSHWLQAPTLAVKCRRLRWIPGAGLAVIWGVYLTSTLGPGPAVQFHELLFLAAVGWLLSFLRENNLLHQVRKACEKAAVGD